MTTQSITIRKKGQMTLPADVRRDLGIDEGDKVILTKRDGEYALTTINRVVDPTAGVLRQYAVDQPPITIEEMDEAVYQGIRESWERFVRETEEEYDK